MQSIEALKLLPVWVNPDHLVATARVILRGHGLRALGVLEGGNLIATVSLEKLATEPDFSEVSVAMDELTSVIDAEMSVRQAAEEFVREGLEYAPVLSGGRYLGIVTSNMLLRELGRSWDPLTSLSWSDRLREWGIENLKRGIEITILFFDLNDFGSYNKRFGHIVGDRVLQRVAGLLSENIDFDNDLLVRYGGDEFAIGTLRSREDAEELADMLKRRVREVFVGETDESVEFSVGVYGGKRTKERENMHYAATLDNLINLASKDCIAHKPQPQQPAFALADVSDSEQVPENLPLVKVIGVYADDQSVNSLTQVILSVGENVVSGVSARMGKPVIESIAIATAKALERGFPDRPLRIGEIRLTEAPDGRKLVTVSGQLSLGDRSNPVGGVQSVEKDLYRSVAEATLQAFLSSQGPV